MDKLSAVATDSSKTIGQLGVHDHFCLIYESLEDQFASVLPFIKIGLERGEKCIYIADDNTAEEVISQLKKGGVATEAELRSGRLTIAGKKDAHLKQGHFDPDWMISSLRSAAAEAKAAGFSALRATCEMTWALGADPGTERLMEYEAKLNYFFPGNNTLAMCQYNRNRFPPEVIKDVISNHPLIIHGGMVCRNFYYIPPDEFLRTEKPDKEIDRLLANIKAYKSLRESEAQFHIIYDQAPIGIGFIDSQGILSDCNEALAVIIGTPREDLIGFNMRMGIHDEAVKAAISRGFTGKRGLIEGDYTAVTSNRKAVLRTIYSPLIEADGAIKGLLFLCEDITERKQLEQELRESKETAERYLNVANEIILALDHRGTITLMNDSGHRLLGYGVGELIGKDWFDTCLPEDVRNGVRLVFGQLMNGEIAGLTNYENRVIDKHGKAHNILWHNTLLKDPGGRITGSLSSGEDITERKQAEEALRQSEERFRSIFEQAGVGAAIIDSTTGRFMRVNSKYAEIVGLSMDELLSTTFMEITHPDDLQTDLDNMEKLRNRLIPEFSMEKRYIRKEGSVVWVSLTVSPLWLYDHDLRQHIAIVSDITGRKQAEERLRRSLEEKTVLLQEIHHRVKNNMQVIYSLLNLQAKGINDETVRARFEDSRNRVYSMALIHERLYRSEDLAHIDFGEYLKGLVDGIADTYKRDDISISLEMEHVVLDVNAGIPCGLIVNELVSNSLKYAFPEGRKGTIRVGINMNREGNYVLFVKDDGIGLPVDAASKDTSSLGLQLVFGLAEQINGRIEIGRAEGTRVSITFPGTHSYQR